MLSDIENLDIMLGAGNDLEREESEFSNYVRRPQNPGYNALVNQDVKSHSNSREAEIRGYPGNGQNTDEIDSSSEINRLSEELNQRITQEMNDVMSSVSSQIQRAINVAINEQVRPQIQATLGSGQRQVPTRRWEVTARTPEYSSEEALNCKFRSRLRDDFLRGPKRNLD